ncbi:MAG TPA: RNA methyltransferase [Flavisolibacter sp.]|nr:RNA methyltransferase [Flavisolibacter sp.]
MLSKKEIKDIQSLSQKKFREALKLFVAEGPKVVSELIQLLPDHVVKLYAVNDWIHSHEKLLSGVPVLEVSGVELQRISQLQTANSVLALFRQLEGTEPVVDSFALYLDTIQDPGNFGTIIRVADWFAIRHIVCSEGCADLYNSKVVQASMASIARVNVYYDLQGTWLKKQQLPLLAATLNGKPVHEYKGNGRGILIIGNESKGISPEIIEMATEKITIPRKGHAESLNAAVATAILLSHLS